MDLILDFDGTITCVDTIAAIASTAAWRRSILQTAGHAQRQRQRTDSVLSNDSGRDGIDRNDCPPTVPFMGVPKQEENTWKTLVDAYIADLALYKASNRRTAEERSVARVSASKFLAGASKSDLCSVGARLETKLGWREFCVAWNDMRFRYPEKIRDPVICSLNWSKDLVSACLSASGLITPERNVLTNDLTYTSDGLTSGTLNAPLLTGEDKVQALESLLRDAPGKLRVYVGDSSSDIPCLTWADIGILLAPTFESAQSLVPRIVPLPEKLQARDNAIFFASSWSEIQTFLSSWLA